LSEWWTYRPSDFLMFSAATYRRLFELHNAAQWPLQWVWLALGLGLLLHTLRRGRWAGPLLLLALAAAWLWAAWTFHWQRYATINWAAPWFAGVFALQAVLLMAAAWRSTGRHAAPAVGRPRLGTTIMLLALLVWPLLSAALRGGLHQAEVFGLAPDPTALATLGALLLLRPAFASVWLQRLLWCIPLLWCSISALTLWTMGETQAWAVAAVALLALGGAWWHETRRCQIV
jgi:Family of unknown function (DUF6064)